MPEQRLYKLLLKMMRRESKDLSSRKLSIIYIKREEYIMLQGLVTLVPTNKKGKTIEGVCVSVDTVSEEKIRDMIESGISDKNQTIYMEFESIDSIDVQKKYNLFFNTVEYVNSSEPTAVRTVLNRSYVESIQGVNVKIVVTGDVYKKVIEE